MKKSDRQFIFNKYGGRCAYSGTPLENDWQIDHIDPVVRNWWCGTMTFKENDCIENMIPCQKIINHYKHSYSLNEFRNWLLGDLHERLKKLPKNPRTDKSKKRKEYILKVAGYFSITEDKPFNRIFYFETINKL
jgi:hypothetical protein